MKIKTMETEKLEKKLIKFQTYQKNLNALIIVAIILLIIGLLLGELSSGTPLGFLFILKYYVYPKTIADLKNELNSRQNQNTSVI